MDNVQKENNRKTPHVSYFLSFVNIMIKTYMRLKF
jgi:hypothetical protein